MEKYFVSVDGVGGMIIKLSAKDAYKMPKMVLALVSTGYREATREEYNEAVRKARNEDKPE